MAKLHSAMIFFCKIRKDGKPQAAVLRLCGKISAALFLNLPVKAVVDGQNEHISFLHHAKLYGALGRRKLLRRANGVCKQISKHCGKVSVLYRKVA